MTTHQHAPSARRSPPAALGRVGWLLLACLLAGCQEQDIRTDYGARTGYGASSVNGTSVLGTMFEDAGHRVRSWRVLSPSLAKADVIVYFPTESKPLSPEAAEWFYDWLCYSYNEDTYTLEDKTLILVGRAYDAEAMYWSGVQTLAPAGLAPQYASRLRSAKANSVTGPGLTSAGEVWDWYTLSAPAAPVTVSSLGGPWADGVDATKATIEHSATITPQPDMSVLLADGAGHPLVSEQVYVQEDDWESGESNVLVIENGSFLLNASLVNHENRKLAGLVVDYIGDPSKDVVFLEAGAEPPISDSDPHEGPPTGLEMFRVWPIGAVLAQLAALGLVFAMAQFPIFGVPRRLERPSLTDFGKHVQALARLLAGARDRAYASGLVRKYFQEER